jgi:hypothetical protein
MAGYKNFQKDRIKNANTANIFNREINKRKPIELSKSARFKEGVKKWAAYYRANPHRFAEEYLNFKFKLFQKFLFFAMFKSPTFVYIAARAQGKSLLVAIYCCTRAILYPGTEIVIAAGTKSQAMRIITEKIEMLRNNSPNLRREIKEVRTSLQSVESNVEFFDTSTITVVASNQGARSLRSHINIYDEFRQIDKDIIDGVLSKFRGSARTPGYFKKDKYKDYPREQNQEIYLSSGWYRSHWSWRTTLQTLKDMLNDKGSFACCIPYTVSIMEHIVEESQIRMDMEKEDFSPISWSMEMEAMFYGENEKSFFKYEELLKIRDNIYPIYPKDFYAFFDDKRQIKYPKKEIHTINGNQFTEVRLVCCDIAAMGGKQNDATVLLILQLIPTTKGYRRFVAYMEIYSGTNTNYQAIRIRQLYDDFDCDYIVLDRRNMGIGIYDSLCMPLGDLERGIQYAPFVSINEFDLLKERSQYSDEAEKKIYTIAANVQFNNDAATELRDVIQKKKLSLLITENDSMDHLSVIRGFLEKSLEIQAKIIRPYKETDELVLEMVNLEKEKNDTGLIKLDEGTGRKDRYTALAYGNYYANVLERETFRKNDNFHWSDYFIAGRG